jgi:hypothetical protein
MILSMTEVRAMLLPGLFEAYYGGPYSSLRQWDNLFIPETPHIWVPKLSLPATLAVGAAATIIKNPEVTRRFWSGWLK